MSGTQYVNLDEPAFIVGNVQMFSDAGVIKAVSDTNPLPVSGSFSITGGATEAKQDEQIVILDAIQTSAYSIDTKTPALGAAAAAASTPTVPVGNIAHDSADSGAPIKTGGRARTSEIAAVANDDRTDAIFDKTGRQVIAPYALPENFVSGAITSSMTGTTSTSLVAAPAGSLRNYITTIIVSNAHATVGTDVVIQDGNDGTVLLTIPAAAVYGGAVINLPVPLRQPTTGTAIYAKNITTGASTKVSAVGFTGL